MTVLVALVASESYLSGQASSDTKRLWEATIEQEGSNLEYKASVVFPQDESVWLVLGKRPAGKMAGPQALVLHGLDHAGKTLSETPLDFVSRDTSLQRPGNDFADLAAVGNGNLALLFHLGEVVTVNARSGHVVGRKDLGAGRRYLNLWGAFSLPDGSLLLAGFDDDGAIAIKLNRALEVVWERKRPRAEVGMLVGGAVGDDDSFFLTGAVEHGRYESISVWAGHFIASGELTKSISLPGQLISVAPASGGGCAVVQGINGPAGQDVWYRRYDRDLKELSNVRLGSGITPNWRPFFAVRVPGIPDEHFVAGVSRQRLLLFRVKADSSIVWTRTLPEQSDPPPELEWNAGLLATKHSVVVPFTADLMKLKMNARHEATGFDSQFVVKVMSLSFGD